MSHTVEIQETSQTVTVQTGVPDATSLQGTQISSTGPSQGQRLHHDGSQWVPRTEVYNVLDYGAAGDGVTDDASAVQSAEQGADDDGAYLFFPAGTYKLSSDTTFSSNVAVVLSPGAVLAPDSGVVVRIEGPARLPESRSAHAQGEGEVRWLGEITGRDDVATAIRDSDIADPLVWLRADDLELSDGDAVGRWPHSGSLRGSFYQNTAADRPTFKTGIINGQPVVRVAVGEYLIGPNANITGDLTIFWVAAMSESSMSANGWLFQHAADGEAEADNISYSLQPNQQSYWHEYSGGTNLQKSIDLPSSDDFYIDGLLRDISAHELEVYRDGALRDSISWSASEDPTGGGNGRLWLFGDASETNTLDDCDLAELLIFDKKLTTAERRRVERYLSDKYGLITADSRTLLVDAGHTWFNDPDAVYDSGADKTLVGGVDLHGDIVVGAYDHAAGSLERFTLKTRSQGSQNDHDNPAFVVLPDGTYRALYSDHSSAGFWTRATSSAGDITAWGSEAVIDDVNTTTYALIARLAGESDKLWLYHRQGVEDRYVRTSTDNGATWSAATKFFENGTERPYMHLAVNGTDRIDFVVSDGHPDSITNNSLYHFYYQGGSYFTSDGTKIGDHDVTLPINPADCTTVYDGSSTGHDGWSWDIWIDGSGNPVIAYAEIRYEGSEHRYRYARWNGTSWDDVGVATAGGPLYGDEKSYSGGIAIADATTLYASREIAGQWEIWKYTSSDGGSTWSGSRIDENRDDVDNIRPRAPKDAKSELPVVWMGTNYTSFTNYRAALQSTLVVR